MSKFSSLVLGIVSGAAMFGAIQYASGNDLRGSLSDRDSRIGASMPAADGSASVQTGNLVNRSGKGDRSVSIANNAVSRSSAQTLTFKVHGLTDTSVVVRLAGTASGVSAKSLPQPRATGAIRKVAIACEPPVSALTEVAKLLQPGRCVT